MMTERDDFRGGSWIQLLASILGTFTLMGMSLGGLVLILASNAQGMLPIPAGQKTSFILLLAGIGFAGTLLLPSAVYAARRLSGLPEREDRSWKGARWSILLFPVFLGIGHLVNINTVGGRILLVAAHIAANSVAVFWALDLGRRGIAKESQQRFWGVFGSGVVLAPALSLLVEFFLLALVGGIWYIYLLQHPDLKGQVMTLMERLPQSAANPAILERMVDKYVFTPGVLISVFSYVAVMIPLVEEIVKPIGVWLLIRRKLTAVEGFTLGVLSGAGYALFENLTLSANAEAWSVVMVSRLGTTAVHMLTSGLVGWGLVSGWTGGRYLRLAKAFMVSFIIHGLWNALNILSAMIQFAQAGEVLGSFGYRLAQYAPVGLFLLAIGSVYGLFRSKRFFQRI